MMEIETPKIVTVESDDRTYAKIVAEPSETHSEERFYRLFRERRRRGLSSQTALSNTSFPQCPE